MEGATLVEGVTMNHFPIDGAEATDYLANWIETMRWREALQGIMLGGITLAGLGLVDLPSLAHRLNLPIIAATRRETTKSDLKNALHAAGLEERLPIVERAPTSQGLAPGLYISWSGTDFQTAADLTRATLNKAMMPEPLRIAHLIGAALVRGTSRGRV